LVSRATTLRDAATPQPAAMRKLKKLVEAHVHYGI
jgi:hypothetical protein